MPDRIERFATGVFFLSMSAIAASGAVLIAYLTWEYIRHA